MQLPVRIVTSPLFQFGEKRNTLKSFLFLLLLLCGAALPFSVELPFVASAKWLFPLEALVPVAAIVVLYLVLAEKNFRLDFTDVAVLIFLAAALLSAMFSEIPLFSAKAFIKLTAHATVFYFGFRVLQLNETQWRLIPGVMTVFLFALLLYAALNHLQLGIHRHHSYEMSLPFSPGHTLLIASGFPLLLYALFRVFQKKDKRLYLSFVLLFVFVTGISFSRIYWALLAAFLFMLIFYHFKKTRLFLLLAAVAGITICYFAYEKINAQRDEERAWDDPDFHNTVFVQLQSMFVWEKSETNIERGNRWKVAAAIFRDHPVTGAGLNTYPDVYFRYKDKLITRETHQSCTRMNAHQLYFGWLSEMGFTGFAAGLLMFAAFFSLVMRLRGARCFIFALLLFVNFFVLGFVEDYLLIEKIMCPFWLSLAFLQHLSAQRCNLP